MTQEEKDSIIALPHTQNGKKIRISFPNNSGNLEETQDDAKDGTLFKRPKEVHLSRVIFIVYPAKRKSEKYRTSGFLSTSHHKRFGGGVTKLQEGKTNRPPSPLL
ncbi:hypothetical protein CDAR_168791 [Caerostris darwini]|uniref:Uncharacterized protein n=1 Tax=Caerostris darwini TaxID=1538125 RepID=A0AAV4WQD0_9ARAC|nr:hypothetical protein CDAR_168791 [Caerostris darwini]